MCTEPAAPPRPPRSVSARGSRMLTRGTKGSATAVTRQVVALRALISATWDVDTDAVLPQEAAALNELGTVFLGRF